MGDAPQGFDARYENEGSTSRLPSAWPKYCIWLLAGLVFSAFWMAGSWNTAQPLLGVTKFHYIAQGFWSLLLTMGCCYAISRFGTRRSTMLGHSLCILLALAAMAGHRL